MNFIKKIKEFENSKILSFAILIYMFICWLVPYTTGGSILAFEYIGQISVGLIAMLALLCFKNTFIVLQILLLFPFMMPITVTFYTLPIGLICAVVLFVIGLIGHLIIYKPKITKMKFLIGLIAFAITLGLGGLGIDYDQKLLKMLALFLIGGAVVFTYIFFTSTTNKKFLDFAELINYVGIIIIGEMFVHILMNFDTFLLRKNIELGWAANSNTIAMMLLCCFPITFYTALKSEKGKALTLYIVSFLELLMLIVSYSRGALLAAFVSFSALMIVFICSKEYRKITLKYIGICLLVVVVSVIVLAVVKPDVLANIYKNLTKINLDSINGRTPIYEKMLNEIVNKPVFGYGLLYNFSNPSEYLWAHNTFLHTTYCLGIVGLLAMLWHHVEKYMYCIKKISIEKVVILISFIAADFYGFIDVNYFLPNFMVILIVLLIMLDSIYKEKKSN